MSLSPLPSCPARLRTQRSPFAPSSSRKSGFTLIEMMAVTAIIGQGGFGYLILTGMQRNFFTTEMIAGAVLSVALAIVADALLVRLQRRLTPWTSEA